MKNLFLKFNDWFHSPESAHLAALLRIGFGGIFLFTLWDFYPVLYDLFGHKGLFGTMNDGYVDLRNPFHLLFAIKEDWILEVWFWGSVLMALATIFGLFSRFSLAVVYASMILFQMRDPWMLFGADKVAKMTGLWLLFADTGQVWSLDVWRRNRKCLPSLTTVTGWPLHAFQLQVAMIYAWAGLHKLSKELWQEGSALYCALQVVECNHDFVPWLLQQKTLLAYMTYGALLVELAFPVLIFIRSTRLIALFSIFALHIGIDLFMHIRLFGPTMYFAFLAFMRPELWRLPKFSSVRLKRIMAPET